MKGVHGVRALVTGAAGFIGSHLSEKLLESGATIRAIDAFTPFYDPTIKRRNAAPLLEHDRFELTTGELSALDLERALDGVDVVYHLAGQPGVGVSWGQGFDEYLNANVLATQRLLEAARKHEGVRLVVASSSSVYGDADRYPTREDAAPRPTSPYGITKLAVEHLCRAYAEAFGVRSIMLRYFSIFGPRQRPDMAFSRFIAAASEGRPLPVAGDGRQSRDFTYVGDAAAATIAAGERGLDGRVYNVAGGCHASVLDAIAVLEEVLGRRIEREHRPAPPGDMKRTGADVELARAELAWAPEVGLREGLKRQVQASFVGVT